MSFSSRLMSVGSADASNSVRFFRIRCRGVSNSMQFDAVLSNSERGSGIQCKERVSHIFNYHSNNDNAYDVILFSGVLRGR